ncbi:hypothetical protein ABI59_13920 [Acidobacteria bacterium Mor1]|nr:hypothetical protein ABI59_13920 [Acidobacteria bacterium Mor1]
MSSQPTAFVTGGTGFVGLNLVKSLIDRGYAVTALHRESSAVDDLRETGATLTVADLHDADGVKHAMPRGVDAVFHVAGNINMWSRRNRQQTRDNVLGTRNVVEAALSRKAGKLVHTSSIAAFGIHDSPIDEDTAENASTSWIHYLRTKRSAETVVRWGIEQGLDATILNPANIVGPHDRSGWGGVIRRAVTGKLPAMPPGRGSFCHVAAVVDAHIAAVERGRTGENYLLGGVDAPYSELVRTAGEVSGRKVTRRTAAAWQLRAYARYQVIKAAVTGGTPKTTPEAAALVSTSMICRSDKAERELGYTPASLEQMVGDAWRWMAGAGLDG